VDNKFDFKLSFLVTALQIVFQNAEVFFFPHKRKQKHSLKYWYSHCGCTFCNKCRNKLFRGLNSMYLQREKARSVKQ